MNTVFFWTPGVGALTIYMQYQGFVNVKVVILTKNVQKKGYFLDENARERVCFEQRVYYSKTILVKFWCCAPLLSNFVHKRVHFGKI